MAVLYAGIVATAFPAWLRPYVQPQRGGPEQSFRAGDLTPLFSVWTQVTARALFRFGEWPLWTDHIYCGEPFFAKPQIGVISLTTLLTGILPAQVVATWTFLLHLWIAGIAMYAWCLRSIRYAASSGAAQDIVPAVCGGASFLLSGIMIGHTIVGHGPIVLVACWTPLVLLLIDRAFEHEKLIRSAALGGVVVAVQLLAGGETMFLYNVIAGALLGLARILCGDSDGHIAGDSAAPAGSGVMRTGIRTVVIGIVIGLFAIGIASVKVLPGLELMPVSNRAGGLTLDDSSGVVLEFQEPSLMNLFDRATRQLADIRHLFALTISLAVFGGFAGLRQPSLRPYAVASIFMVIAGVAIAHSHDVFAILWQVMPMFRYQRIPQRALILTYLGLSPLITIGVFKLVGALRESRGRWTMGLLVFAGVLVESWIALPSQPPVADIRKEVRENSILNYVAQQPGEFRIHAIESTDRNWGIEHVTVPLGLDNLTGWDHLWLRDYLGPEGITGREVRPFLVASYAARHPARFWGMMNVRFVTAMTQVNADGFRFVGRFPISPSSQPAKSAGPFLYECDPALPRAWIVPNAILVLGEPAERLEATYQLMDHDRFDPSRVVTVQCDLTELNHQVVPTDYQAIAMPVRWSNDQTVQSVLRSAGPVLKYASVERQNGRQFSWEQPSELNDVLTRLTEFDSPSTDADRVEPKSGVVVETDTKRGSYRRLKLPGHPGFLVLAEKFAQFPGWSCHTERGECSLLRGNAVATVVRLDGSERAIELRYFPKGLAIGLWITLVSLPIVVLSASSGDRWMARWTRDKAASAAPRGRLTQQPIPRTTR